MKPATAVARAVVFVVPNHRGLARPTTAGFGPTARPSPLRRGFPHAVQRNEQTPWDATVGHRHGDCHFQLFPPCSRPHDARLYGVTSCNENHRRIGHFAMPILSCLLRWLCSPRRIPPPMKTVEKMRPGWPSVPVGQAPDFRPPYPLGHLVGGGSQTRGRQGRKAGLRAHRVTRHPQASNSSISGLSSSGKSSSSGSYSLASSHRQASSGVTTRAEGARPSHWLQCSIHQVPLGDRCN